MNNQQLTFKGQWIGWLCLAILVGFTWLPDSYFLMVSWPWIVVWQLGFLFLLLWTIWMLRQFQIPFRRLGYGLDWAVGAIAIALLLSVAMAQFREVAIWYFSRAIPYGISLYVLRNWLGRGKLTISRLWTAISLVGVVTCMVGWVKWYPELAAGAPRNQWPMGHPNFVAGYLVLVLPLTIALALARKGWQQIGAWAAAALMAAVLYSTSSRGGFLGIFVLVLAGMIIFVIRGQGSRRWWRLVACVGILAIVFSVALQNSRVRQIIQVASPSTETEIVQLRVDGQTQDRLWMLQAAGNIWRDKPIFGVGVGNMSRVYNLYRPIETGVGATNVQQLHNTPVQIFGELGLVGLGAYLLLVGVLSVLWCLLYQKLSQLNERLLLYGIGGGLLGYSASSLTDYQLENISISTTLVLLIVLLIGLADRHLNVPESLKKYSRRWLSLGGIAFWISLFLFWLPISWAMQLSLAATQDFQRGKITTAYEKLAFATDLVSWDPIYYLLAGFQALEVRDKVGDSEIYQELTKLITTNFEAALKASPYDPGFNQNLGMIYREAKINQPHIYFSRTIQLLPRSEQYTYYLLGREYLEQGKRAEAITAFALQGIIKPELFTSAVWEQLPLANIQESVLEESLKLSSQLLKELSPDDPNYDVIYETQVVWRWWYQKPLENIDKQKLRPIIQALFLTENSPQTALELLNLELKKSPKASNILLLKAWIDPDKYLANYFNSNPDLKSENKQLVRDSIYQDRKLRSWLKYLRESVRIAYRPAFNLPYRNQKAQEVAKIIMPEEIKTYSIVKLLKLFPNFPRSIPQLEDLVDQVKTDELNLPQPANNNFQILPQVSTSGH